MIWNQGTENDPTMFARPRSHIIVNLGGDWRRYTDILPKNTKPIGVIVNGHGVPGALVQTPRGGYVQVNSGVVSSLSHRKVRQAIRAAGCS